MTQETIERLESHNQMRTQAVRAALSLDALHIPVSVPTSQRRRTGVGLATDSGLMLALIEDNGVWRLRESGEGTMLPTVRRARRRSRRADAGADELDSGELIPLKRLSKDKVRSALIALDRKLTPKQGLRPLDLTQRTLGEPVPFAKKAKRVLVFVHGTFSEGQAFLNGFDKAPEGSALFQHLASHYDAVYAFDHPTLTVDPVMNARTLAVALAASGATVDIVCHSRGGLVTRWWADALEKGSAKPGKIVFAGAPLAGTGLAAAPNLRKTLDMLANISAGLGFASAGIPFLQAAIGLFQAFSSAARFASTTPIPDVLIGLVPGLRAMSRVENNSELDALRLSAIAPDAQRFFIRSNFESEKIGWQFWKAFRAPLDRAKDIAADAIFDGHNDLVVDTPSMTDWAGSEFRVRRANICDFATSDSVHHTNYFEQERTVKFLLDCLR